MMERDEADFEPEMCSVIDTAMRDSRRKIGSLQPDVAGARAPYKHENGEIDRNALYEELQPLVRRLIRRYGDDVDARRELRGEIFCRFCHLMDVFDPARGVPLRPYLIRQLPASVHTYARKRWHIRKREVHPDVVRETAELGLCYDVADAHDKLAREHILEIICAHAAGLSPRQRKVFVWRFYDNRSFEEIARTLEIEITTVRSNLRHAINKIREALQSHEDAWHEQPAGTKVRKENDVNSLWRYGSLTTHR